MNVTFANLNLWLLFFSARRSLWRRRWASAKKSPIKRFLDGWKDVKISGESKTSRRVPWIPIELLPLRRGFLLKSLFCDIVVVAQKFGIFLFMSSAFDYPSRHTSIIIYQNFYPIMPTFDSLQSFAISITCITPLHRRLSQEMVYPFHRKKCSATLFSSFVSFGVDRR